MSIMCNMEGCKAKKGLCKHEKAMLVMAGLAIVAFIGWSFV